jgi:predicted O-methyltransferase YrrM
LLRKQPESFDLIFIDGWHTFDQTMLDMFYANRLVRMGGYILVDDCNWESVAAAVSYYMNYPAYEWLREPTMAARTRKMRVAKAGRTLLPPRIAHVILPASFIVASIGECVTHRWSHSRRWRRTLAVGLGLRLF